MVQKRIQSGSEEYAFFTYKVNGKPHFGIVNPGNTEDGKWYFNQGANAPLMEEPLETLIIQKVPPVIGGVINDKNITKVRIRFADGYNHLEQVTSENKYFFKVIKHDSSVISKIEGLDANDRVVFTSWDLEKPAKSRQKK